MVASIVPSATPSTVAGIEPSWPAGNKSTLILPPERPSTPALNVFIHSCVTSPTVGDEIFIVNCCAATGAAAIAAANATAEKRAIIVM